ncbi:phosphatase PAP2 family protein [Rhodopirellula sp. JC740]|uniref:Phosphatase PAP2 family protein n=1 Tax=Rhodopirellula halodulae TaxID=2894198 RepID=A0ABS8NNP2_9BACT|nr:phosphatase PAP2 family protein [Rhodopirellula sp. JC740]MCC9645214.1 phosphatase PAP2 family protein [Rhodopirellula sp. JC740]
MATISPTAYNTPLGRDVVVGDSCDGLFDLYLLESDVAASARTGVDPGVHDRGTLWQRVVSDHRNYYDFHSFKMLAGGFLVGAAVANTQLDQEIQNHFQASVRGATSDDWFESLHSSKELGNGRYTLPVFATAWAAGTYFDETQALATTGRWGERSLRSFLVGAPPLILAQRFTGGSRPGEKDRNSRWLPFQDNNGVSGHAFMSSLPFINAAKMTDRPLLKSAFYAGSLLGPLSRVNDDDHYPSQVALGWWMAYVAATAIDRTEIANRNLTFYPYLADNGGTGAMIEWRF